jgi:hypothetical protein
MQDQAPASAGESGTEGPHHELTEDYERSDGQFFSVALAGIAAGQPGSTGLGLANEGGITIEMSDSQASWQDRPYQQEVTMTNPPSWGYDLAGGEAARFIELSGQMASREQAGIEQDEAGQALRRLGMTPSAEKPASGRPWPHHRRHVRAVRPGCPGPGQRRARTPRRDGAGHGVLLEGRGARRAGMRAAARRYRRHLGASRAPVPDAATADSIESGTPDAHRRPGVPGQPPPP